MSTPERIPANAAREKVMSGRALLVCAYDDEEKCAKLRLEGAMSLNAFRSKLPSLSKDQELVFYCA